VDMTDLRLKDFFYPDEDEPVGVLERELTDDVVAVVDAGARATYDEGSMRSLVAGRIAAMLAPPGSEP
jgi:hypothetical protein